MAMLVLMHEGLTIKEIPLEKPLIRIGRKIGSEIFLEDKLASQNHAKIEILPDPKQKGHVIHILEDLQSTNHTYVNGQEITRKELVHEDTIRIGKHVFKFIEEAAMDGDKTTKLHKSWIRGVYYTKE
ncbi:MAG: FHA domain-containing protein [Desulfobacteraceae bacterium]|nr:FHA domain-containing protein [Desulfobacteraceae bacterium]